MTTHKHEIYSFVFRNKKSLTIKSNGYNGIKIFFEVFVGKTKITIISCDIAIEELKSDDGIETREDIRIYTIERTLVGKFTTLIVHGERNTRHKDMVDLKELYKHSNNALLNKLIERLFVPREITSKKYTPFKNNYATYPVIKDNGVESIICNIINKISIY